MLTGPISSDTPAEVYSGHQLLNVGSDIGNLTLTLRSAVDVTGKIVVSNGSNTIDLKSARFGLVARDAILFSQTSYLSLSKSNVADSSGAFVIQKVVPGACTFWIDGLPEGTYIADLRQEIPVSSPPG